MELKDADKEGLWYYKMSGAVAFSFDRDKQGQVTAMNLIQINPLVKAEVEQGKVEGKPQAKIEEKYRPYIGSYINFSGTVVFKAFVKDGKLVLEYRGKDIIELNQIEQLQEGIDALGQKIVTISAEEQKAGNVYSFKSIQERGALGLQVDKVDLKITGTFWDTFKLVKVNNGWKVEANYTVNGDDIRENFESKYDFTGLTDNNLEVFVYQYLLPLLTKKIRSRLKL